MDRSLKQLILKDLPSKIVLLSGPRQSGKTTLSKQLYSSFNYLNYDASESRQTIIDQSWDREQKLIIFDELYKMKNWKRWIKGVYDTEGIPPELLITGSAKLDIHRRVGDSLAGRYFQYRLHPLDTKEICQQLSLSAQDAFDSLWNSSGFPEPFLKDNPSYYKRWRTTHIDIILRQDMIDLTSVRDIDAIKTLVVLLRQRAGSSISYANLARDLERDPNTIKRWLQLLENLYIIYRVTPYHKNIARSLLKEPKFYFYDHGLIENSDGAKLENMVANAIKKELHFLEDTEGKKTSLHYLRTKDGKEIDFLICIDDQPQHMIEVKTSDTSPSKGFEHFSKFFEVSKQTQLVKNITRKKTYPSGLKIESLIQWLETVKI